jgi:hypothetical protein
LHGSFSCFCVTVAHCFPTPGADAQMSPLTAQSASLVQAAPSAAVPGKTALHWLV